jgi:carotenoid cleavage dioxygenase-like enzyme
MEIRIEADKNCSSRQVDQFHPTSFPGTNSIPHRFDAISMVHKFEIRNGEVSYRNRYIADGFETWIKQHGSFPAAQTFAGDPCQRIWGAFMSKFWPGGTNHPANIGVTFSRLSGAKKLVSKTDANALLEIDPVTLDPVPPTFRYTDLVPAARGPLSAAHGHYDPERATFYNYTLDIRGPMSMYHVAAMPDAGGNGHVVASVRAPPAYVHSFAATKDYIILMIFPAVLNSLKMAVFQSHMKALQWEPQRGTVFHVISKDARNGQAVATYRSDAFFCFHQVRFSQLNT